MEYSSDPNGYEEELLRKVARLWFFERKQFPTIQRISQELNIPRAKAAAMCEAVFTADFVHISIAPSRRTDPGTLRDLEASVRERYELKDCRIVHGRGEMTKQFLFASAREAILDEIVSVTTGQVERHFLNRPDAPFLAVSYGFVTRKVADALRPSNIREDGMILSAQGVRHKMVDRFDATNICRDFARKFGCRYSCLSIPALVDNDHINTVRNLKLVREIIADLDTRTNMVLGSLASLHQKDSLQNELLSEEDLAYVESKGAIGNFGGWMFDANGDPVEYENSSVVGLGLARMRELVKQGKPVILAVGADPSRVPALAVALDPSKKPIANVWIGDEVSARVLLGQQRLDVDSFRAQGLEFSPSELKVLRELTRH
jgi:DNA-binding transcriptional regulator LsrR (DeoR family)